MSPLGPTTHAVERWAERIRDFGGFAVNRGDLMNVLAAAEIVERPDWIVGHEGEATEYRLAGDVCFVIVGESVVTVMTKWDQQSVSVAKLFHRRAVTKRAKGMREKRHAPRDRSEK